MWYTNMADSNSCYASGHVGEKTLLHFKNCCISNYLIGDLKDHFTAKIPDSAFSQFTSGLAHSQKGILLIKQMGLFRAPGLSI